MDTKKTFSLLVKIGLRRICLGIILFYGCKNNNTSLGYPNYEKWETGNVYTPAKLRGKPKEVKESFYGMLTDTSFVPGLTGKRNDYNIYRFDGEGNLIFRQFYIDSLFTGDFYYKYDENGHHYEFVSYGTGDTSRSKMLSVRIGKGKFKSEKIREGKIDYVDITTVLNNGEEIVIERWDKDSVISGKTRYYANGKLVKVVSRARGEVTESTIYYSAKGVLDSLVEKNKNQVSSRAIYINNDYGDPIYYEESDLQGDKKRLWMKYEYDSVGNWVKQITRQEGGDIVRTGNTPTADKHPEYTLLIREIKY